MSERREKILMVMTHRLGDVLQTFPAVALLRLRRPSAEIHFLCDDSCAALAALCPDIDKVHAFPRRNLLPAAEQGPATKLGAVLALADGLRSERFDQVVNLMGNASAALMAYLAVGSAGQVAGRSFGPVGMRPLTQRFGRLLMALPAARDWQPFHLSELFVRLTAESLGLEPTLLAPRLSFDRERGIEGVRRLAPTGDDLGLLGLRRPWVGLQGGASKALRKPPAAWLRSFGREFFSRLGGTLFLLGSREEAEAFEPLLRSLVPAQRRRCIVATGAFDVPALADLLACLDSLVSVDTFTLHLANAVGLPSLGLFPGPASPHETGPFGPGHMLLWADREDGPCRCEDRCDGGQACWDRLHPELVSGALQVFLMSREMEALRGRRVRVFEPDFGPQAYALRSLDGVRERGRAQADLAACARAWATGAPVAHPCQQSALAQEFHDLAQGLTKPDNDRSRLALRGSPGDWFRAQALAAHGEDGRADAVALADIAGGARYFSRSLLGAVSVP